MLFDRIFLDQLFSQHNITKYAKIIRLDNNEKPEAEIVGQITSGSLSKDEKSNVRRVCNLSLSVADFSELDYKWGLSKKFNLEIGIKNNIDDINSNIIWFKQGIFIITSFSSSIGINNRTVNISGKDKMCLLNGDIGGKLHAQIDFGKEEYVINDEITTYEIPIKTIIRKMLIQYGNELPHKILIQDLDDYGLQLLENSNNKELYLARKEGEISYSKVIFDENTEVFYGSNRKIKISELPSYEEVLLSDFIELDNYYGTLVSFEDDNNLYYIAKISPGEPVGYKQIDLIYPGELIGNVGESLTSILDKIIKTFSEFEYFYDEEGNFIFRKKKIYSNPNWISFLDENQEYSQNNFFINNPLNQKIFKDAELINSYSLNFNLTNLANDFSIWGERTGVSGAKIPIHIRYAIDDKPKYYKSIKFTKADLKIYNISSNMPTKEDNYIQESKEYYTKNYRDDKDAVDWREVLYQMAKDWYKGNYLDDFGYRLQLNNPDFIDGKTGYEQYYVDIYSFWRTIYENGKFIKDYKKDYSTMNFWFDFLDTDEDSELFNYSVKKIGDRLYSIKDSSINSLYNKQIPNIIYYNKEVDNKLTGYSYIKIENEDSDNFTVSSKYKSALDTIQELIYNKAYCVESQSISIIPDYSLQLGDFIFIQDIKNNINNQYLINQISENFTSNLMNLNITKVPKYLL